MSASPSGSRSSLAAFTKYQKYFFHSSSTRSTCRASGQPLSEDYSGVDATQEDTGCGYQSIRQIVKLPNGPNPINGQRSKDFDRKAWHLAKPSCAISPEPAPLRSSVTRSLSSQPARQRRAQYRSLTIYGHRGLSEACHRTVGLPAFKDHFLASQITF